VADVDWERARREREDRAARAASTEDEARRTEQESARRLHTGVVLLCASPLLVIAGVGLDQRALFVVGIQLAGIALAALFLHAVERATGAPLKDHPEPRRSLVRGVAVLLVTLPALGALAWVLSHV
jgi:hypothetical protein